MRRALVLAALLFAFPAQAAELRMITGGATLEVEEALAEDFTRETGIAVVFTTGTAGQVRDRVLAGEPADVVAASAAVLAALEQAGAVRPGSAAVLGRTGIGVAVREGAPRPAIATAAEFRAAILAARSIVYMDPASGASSGIAMARTLRELGIADQVAGKTLLLTGGYTAEKVVSGEAGIALQNISELIAVPGAVLVGPLPPELQTYTTYSAGIAAASPNQDAARAFIEFLTRTESAARWRAAGIEPGAGN